jgi:hypothetical protein
MLSSAIHAYPMIKTTIIHIMIANYGFAVQAQNPQVSNHLEKNPQVMNVKLG